MWARDREAFGEDRRRRPIEAKESTRWPEGFKRCAELAASLPDIRLVYVADRECDIREFMVRARRQPQLDWLIRTAQDRKLAESDRLWERLAQAPVWGEVTVHPPGPTEPAGGAGGAGRAGDSAPRGRRTGGGDRAAGAGRTSSPAGVEPLDWRLLTNRPAETLAAAAELIQWYGGRWTILGMVVAKAYLSGFECT